MSRQSYLYAAGSLVTLVVAMATNLLVARHLGPDLYGEFTVSRTFAQLLILLAPLGLDLGLQKFLAQGLQRGEAVQYLLRFARLAAATVSLLALIAVEVGGGIYLENAYRSPGLSHAIVLSLLACPFVVDTAIVFAVGRVLGDMRAYCYLILFAQPILRLTLVVAALSIAPGLDGILFANIAASFLSWLSYLMLEKRMPQHANVQPRRQSQVSQILDLSGTSIWLGVSVFFYGLMRTADALILGLVLPMSDVGRYSVISLVAQTVQSLALAASQGLGARVATIPSDDHISIVKVIDEASRKALPLSLYLFGGVAVFGSDLDLLFGTGFSSSGVTSFFLSFGYLVGGVLGIVGYALSMTGAHRRESILILAGGLALPAASYAGAKFGGIEGVAFASCATIVAVNTARVVAVKRRFGLVPLAPKLLPLAIVAWIFASTAREVATCFRLTPVEAFVLGTSLYSLGFGILLLGLWIGLARASNRNAARAGGNHLSAVVLSFHFSEYSSRLAIAMSTYSDTSLVLSARNARHELSQRLRSNVNDALKTIYYADENILAKLRSSRAIIAHCWRVRPSVVIAHETGVPLQVITALLCTPFSQLRLIVHDPSPHKGQDSQIAKKRRFWISLLRLAATDFVVHGEVCRDALLASTPRKRRKVFSIPHGIILEPDKDEVRSPKGRSALFFGRLEEYKGLPLLFEACSELAKEVPDFSIRIRGTGSLAAEVGKFAAARPFVRFTEGYVSPEELVTEIQQCRIVLLPYEEATQSGVLAAAIANGRPVVATDVGSLGEVVSPQNGALVHPRDCDGFVREAKRMLLDDDYWQSLSDGCRHTADAKLSWHLIAQTILRGDVSGPLA